MADGMFFVLDYVHQLMPAFMLGDIKEDLILQLGFIHQPTTDRTHDEFLCKELSQSLYVDLSIERPDI